MPDNFLNHFIRGFIDGDGWISFNPVGRKKKWPRALLGICGTTKILILLRKILSKQCSTSKKNKLLCRGSIFALQYGGCRQVRRINLRLVI